LDRNLLYLGLKILVVLSSVDGAEVNFENEITVGRDGNCAISSTVAASSSIG
jgi:hypothetical protein